MSNNLTGEFLDELFKCSISRKTFLDTIIPCLKKNYLPNESYQKVWKEIVEIYRSPINTNRNLPTIGLLCEALKRDKECLKIIGRIRRIVELDYEGTKKSLQDYIKQNMFVESHGELADIYNQGNFQQAYKLFMDSAKRINDFSLNTAKSDRIFANFKSRNRDRILNQNNIRIRIPTGIDSLDELMDGGPETGEFTMFLADSGVGKSILLNTIGVNAARFGINVYHEQVEGTKEQVMGRYDACWTGSLYKEIKKGELPEKTLKKIYRVIKNISGEIFVNAHEQFGNRTMVDVRNSLIELLREFDIKLLLLDYFELFDPGDGRKYSASEERFRQTAIGRFCKNLATEFNIAVVTVTQSSSIPPEMLNDPDFVITRFNLSEDKGKIRPVDNFITINQTKDEKKLKVCRLYTDKFREHESGDVIPLAQNLGRARFYDRKKTFSMFLVEEDEE